MKKIGLASFFFLIPIFAFSQYIPSWINYGMTENSIKTALGVDQDGYVKNSNGVVVGVYVGKQREESNLFVYMEDTTGLLNALNKPIDTLNQLNNIEKLFSSINRAILYYFLIDQNDGLKACIIYLKKEFEEVLVDFINRYGRYNFHNDQFIWTRSQNNILPLSTRAVSINLLPEDGKFVTDNVRIVYYLLEK